MTGNIKEIKSFSIRCSEEELMEMTEEWDEHPEWWDLPCICQMCCGD